MLYWVGVLAVSLAILVKSSEIFTNSAEKLGKTLGLSPFVIGVTIVAIGTSLPELVSSIVAVVKGASEIVIGNVVGSNIANTMLILGIAAIVSRKMLITHEIVNVDFPFLVGSTFLLVLMLLDGEFTIFEGVLSIFLLAVYVLYLASQRRDEYVDGDDRASALTVVKLIASALLLYISADYTVESVIKISTEVGVGRDIIAATVVLLEHLSQSYRFVLWLQELGELI